VVLKRPGSTRVDHVNLDKPATRFRFRDDHLQRTLGRTVSPLRTHIHLAHFVKKVFRSTLSDSEPLQPQIDELERSTHIVSSLGIELDDKAIAFAIIYLLTPVPLRLVGYPVLYHGSRPGALDGAT